MLQTQTPAHFAGRESSTQTDATEQASLARLLAPNGERLPNAELDPWVAELDAAAIGALYQDMAIIRRLDAEGTALQRQGQIALWPPLLGQEAAQIGSARALRSDDFVFSSYREMGVVWARGVRPSQLNRVWRGVTASGWDPFEAHMAPLQVIIGAQTLHATGYALGIQNDGADAAAVAYFGDGATSQGDVNEAMVFAASFQAPVVFFCQNNHWAISEPVGLQASRPIADRAPGFGIPSMRVDGNDVLAVLAATRIALDRARTGGGPSFIEAVTYRMGPHTTADDPRKYRDPAELELWAGRDPLARVEAFLRGQGAFTAEFEQQVAEATDAAAAEVRAETIAIPDPDPMELFDHVYAEPHTGLARERADYLRYLSQFEEPAAPGQPQQAGQAGGAR
ncbi:pyruvate dehydrogenase (acetyl-transferring) E1 component subunit alpha [Microterricola viridarii]|uniref:Pyruvate dehydrogenase E1 component alpha subunit n=1 Tax=Microterricola viridarii TaxID=412690 RepID=A0A1H1X677_9MICO|nr:pyruvate dehydrogenase (acetyl-transferring) E1 component subunit alpha [Microterricola viridarii]SDT04136.1 pyruvate dehydrogenase E1 component alpha subunit [Microterricola viridarii]